MLNKQDLTKMQKFESAPLRIGVTNRSNAEQNIALKPTEILG